MKHLIILSMTFSLGMGLIRAQSPAPIQLPIVPQNSIAPSNDESSVISLPSYQDSSSAPVLKTTEITATKKKVVKVDHTKKFTAQHPFNRAIINAFNTNPQLRSKVKSVYAAAEGVAQANADWRPSIGLQGTFGRSWADQEVPERGRGATWTSPRTATASVSQNLYRGGQTVAKVEQAKASVYAGFADLANTEQTILLNAISAYLDLWAKQNVLKLNENNVAVKQKTLNQTRARYDVGEVTMTDVAQAQSDLAASTAQMVSAKADVASSIESYIQVVGEAPHDVTAPPPLAEIQTMPINRDEVQQKALKNHPSIRQAEYNKKSSYAAIDAAESALLPVLDFEVNAGRTLQGSSKESRSNSASALLKLNIPIYQKGAEWSAIRQTTQTAAQSKIDLVTAQRQVQQQGMQSWETWKGFEQQIDQIKIQIESAKISLEGVRQENLVGERTLLEVLTSENALLQAQTNLVNIEQKYLQAGYQLLSSMGELMAVDMGLPVDPYPVYENYERVKDQLGGRSDYPIR